MAFLPILQPGEIVRFYEIVRLLDEGQGGMSAVYEAQVRLKYRNPDLPERLALKVALPDFEDRLRSEADFMGRFDHPNVVKAYPIPRATRPAFVGRTKLRDRNEVSYMAMELLNGGSLTAQLERRHHLPLREAVSIARDLARALSHIHSKGIINLDIKPDNILFRGQGLRRLGRYPPAVLCDFGIARDLNYPRFGEHAASIPFAAPEQIIYGDSDPSMMGPHSDIFQWGIVFYLMVTGELPFGPDLTGIVDFSRVAVPMSRYREAPPELDDLVLRALNKSASLRFQTADQALLALERVKIAPGS